MTFSPANLLKLFSDLHSAYRGNRIYIYQMGKVGSKTLKTTLDNHFKSDVIHFHRLYKLKDAIKRQLMLQRDFMMPVYIISPIREPVSRNVSAFFQNFSRETGLNIETEAFNADRFKTLFLENNKHIEPIEWFEQELLSTFGINVYQQPFSPETAYRVYKKRNINVLVYQSELDKNKQLEILSRFLNKQIDEFLMTNVSDKKSYSDAYNAFLESVQLPEEYCRDMLNSAYARHFYSTDQRENAFNRWTGTNTGL